RCRCSASVGSAITRRGATIGSPNPIPHSPLITSRPKLRKPNILLFWNLYTGFARSFHSPTTVCYHDGRCTLNNLKFHGAAMHSAGPKRLDARISAHFSSGGYERRRDAWQRIEAARAAAGRLIANGGLGAIANWPHEISAGSAGPGTCTE